MNLLIAAVLLTSGFLTAALVVFAVRGASPEVRSPDKLLGLTIPVDIASFRNLVNRNDEAFLRANMDAGDFSAVRHARQRATIAYLQSVSHNAAVLLRLAEAARTASDPAIANAAHQLAQDAVQLRLRCIALIVRLRAAILLPALSIPESQIAEHYQLFTGSVLRFVSLGDPAWTSRVSETL